MSRWHKLRGQIAVGRAIHHLAKLQESLKIPRLAVLSFVRTRWLCRGQVSARLLTALPALQLEFKADAEANVKTAAALYELSVPRVS